MGRGREGEEGKGREGKGREGKEGSRDKPEVEGSQSGAKEKK